MTNEEIIDTTRGTELWQYYGEEINKLLDLARQDEREKWKPYLLDSVLTDAEFKEYTGSEREKMQGVEAFIAWDGLKEEFELWIGNDYATSKFGGIVDYRMAKALGIEPKSQCKKFRIVEDLP